MNTCFSSKFASLVYGLVALAIIGEIFLWFFMNEPLVGIVPLGSTLWYLFSFFSGILASLLPFGLSFVLLITPSFKKHGLIRGGTSLLALASGLLFIFVCYGLVAALFGKNIIEWLPKSVSNLNDWLLVFIGLFVYILALGEIGLVRFRMSSYGSASPKFIQSKGHLFSFFLLGVFLGNIGVGSIYPAIPLLLVKSFASASMPFGVALFAIHAIGRIIPLGIIALLIAFGFDGAKWISRYGKRMMKINGWLMIAVASMVMTLGAFSHYWFESTHLYSIFSGISELGIFFLPHASEISGVFGIPIDYAIWFFVFLVLLPIWLNLWKEYRRVYGTPALEMQNISHTIDDLESSRRHLEVIAHIPDGEHGSHIRSLEKEIDELETKRRILEDAVRYGSKSGLRNSAEQHFEQEHLRLRGVLYLTASLLIVILALITF